MRSNRIQGWGDSAASEVYCEETAENRSVEHRRCRMLTDSVTESERSDRGYSVNWCFQALWHAPGHGFHVERCGADI